ALLQRSCPTRRSSDLTRNNRLAAIRAFITYASACRPEYISLSSELAAIKIQKKERFREVDYMSEDAVKALFAAPDTRTKMGLRRSEEHTSELQSRFDI